MAITVATLTLPSMKTIAAQVRNTPCRPKNWANSSPFFSRVPTGMHGPTCIVWADLTPSPPQRVEFDLVPDDAKKPSIWQTVTIRG
jgi:hypothetical protein